MRPPSRPPSTRLLWPLLRDARPPTVAFSTARRPMCSRRSPLPLGRYSTILTKIEDNGYDNFNKRAYTAKWEKLAMLPRAYLRVAAPDLGL